MQHGTTQGQSIVRRIALIVPTVLIAGCVAFFVLDAFNKHQYALSLVPKELKPTGVTFDMSGGESLFGLSGFDYHVVIYSMDAAEADRVTRGGIAYLNSFAEARTSGPSDDTRGATFEVWHKTPARYLDERIHPSQPSNSLIRAHRYLSHQEGELMNLPREVDDLLSSQYGFYSAGRVGYLVVVPQKQKILFIYSRR